MRPLLYSATLIVASLLPISGGAQAPSSRCVAALPTTQLSVSGTVDETTGTISPSSIPIVSPAGTTTSTTTFTDLEALAAHRTSGIRVTDALGESHPVEFFFFHIGTRAFEVRAYLHSEDVDPTGVAQGLPRSSGSTFQMTFAPDGSRSNPQSGPEIVLSDIPWNNGSSMTQDIGVSLADFELFAGTPVFSANDDGALTSGVTTIQVPGPQSSLYPAIIVGANLDARAPAITIADVNALSVSAAGTTASTATFGDLQSLSAFEHVLFVPDSSDSLEPVRVFYFKTAANSWNVRAYVASDDVDPGTTSSGLPRAIGPSAGFSLSFNSDGTRSTSMTTSGDLVALIPWNQGRTATGVALFFGAVSQLAASSQVCSTYLDSCPGDSSKLNPGACGCGEADIDTDTDGILDCFDGCPSDPLKTSAGVCGCGVADSDLNQNGASDCLDPSESLIPSIASTAVSGRAVSLGLQEFTGRVRYRIILRASGVRKQLFSSSPNRTVRKLRPGAWTVRYAVAVRGTSGYTESTLSVPSQFMITR